MRTTILIPCYNEAAGIAGLCQRLRLLLAKLDGGGETEVLFVDDGSTDGTADAIRREAADLPYRIVTHERNRGLGAALRTGFDAAKGEEIVTLDSDCTYDPLQAVELLRALRSGYQVVTGSPYHPEGEVEEASTWRLLLSKSLSWIYWLIVPQRLYTYTSCFRAYRKEVLPQLDLQDDGFLAVTRHLVSAIMQGLPVAEVPARLTVRRTGKSKIKIVRVSLSHLGYIAQILWRRIA